MLAAFRRMLVACALLRDFVIRLRANVSMSVAHFFAFFFFAAFFSIFKFAIAALKPL